MRNSDKRKFQIMYILTTINKNYCLPIIYKCNINTNTYSLRVFFLTPTSLKNTLTNTKMMKEKKNEKLFKIKLELQFGK